MKHILRNGSLIIFLAGMQAAAFAATPQTTILLTPMGGTTVAVDGHVPLSLVVSKTNGGFADALPGALNGATWSINGLDPVAFQAQPQEGSFSLDMTLGNATYTAPHTVPPTNPVAVSFIYRPSPDSPQTVTLVCNIKVVDRKNFLSISDSSLPSNYFELNEKYSTSQTINSVAHGIELGDVVNVIVSAMEPNGAGGGVKLHANAMMNVMLTGASPGKYAWQLPPGNMFQTMIGVGGSMNQYSAADCNPHGDPDCKMVILPGSTQVLSYDANSGRLEGEFSGTVVKMLNGKPTTYASASGSFSVHLTGPGGQ